MCSRISWFLFRFFNRFVNSRISPATKHSSLLQKSHSLRFYSILSFIGLTLVSQNSLLPSVIRILNYFSSKKVATFLNFDSKIKQTFEIKLKTYFDLFQSSTVSQICQFESRSSSRRVNRLTWPAATTLAETPCTALSGTRVATSSIATCRQKLQSSKRFRSKTWKLM
jgi:hypothetical protein